MPYVPKRFSVRSQAQWATWYALKKTEQGICVYCGMVADTLDHYPPISSSPRTGVLLPACRECNAFARDLYPYDFIKRVEHVKNRIRKKHARMLRRMPVWEADELDEMSGHMRRDIELWQRKRRIVHARLVWDVVNYLRQLVATRSFAARDAESDHTRDIVVTLLRLSPGRTGPFTAGD